MMHSCPKQRFLYTQTFVLEKAATNLGSEIYKIHRFCLSVECSSLKYKEDLAVVSDVRVVNDRVRLSSYD